MKEIIIASNNEGKIKEIKEIFKDYNIVSLKEANISIEIEENKDTFKENAIKKAMEISKLLNGANVIADDSGLCIEYLDGYPGVITHRICNGTDRDRNNILLSKMIDVPKENRKIKHIAAIALILNGNLFVEEGVLNGYLSAEPKGENGFGFDEIFELEDGRTLAELNLEEKNNISARHIALKKIEKNI